DRLLSWPPRFFAPSRQAAAARNRRVLEESDMADDARQASGNTALQGVRIDQATLQKLHTLHQRFVKTMPHGRRAVLRQCDLRGLVLNGLDFSMAEFVACNFSGAALRGGSFRNANIFSARFDDADLSGAEFARADLRGATFERANLTDTRMNGADLRDGSIMRDADGAHDGSAGSTFIGALLRGTNMAGCKLKNADFSGALLDCTDFSSADLRA